MNNPQMAMSAPRVFLRDLDSLQSEVWIQTIQSQNSIVQGTETMVAATSSSADAKFDLEHRLQQLELDTHFDAFSEEPVSFLNSVAEAAGHVAEVRAAGPTAQDIECLRQAAWKYSRQTAKPVANAEDLKPVLHRLGYL